MEKRAFTLVDSPRKQLQHDVNKKMKLSQSPKKSSENDANLINSDSVDELLDGLCFDNDSFLEDVLKVSKILFIIENIKLKH